MPFIRTLHPLFLSLTLTGAVLASAVAPLAHAAPADQAVCAVCGPREGAGLEPVKATATLKGKTYAFCSASCKVEFLQNPNEFLITDEGKPAPAFTLKDLSGKAVSLSDFKGKVVLADFWSTSCIPCVKALPYLQSLHKKYGPRGFVLLGLSIDEKTAPVEKLVRRFNVTYPMVMANSKVWSAYRVNALPSLTLIGRDGKIIRRYGEEADRKAMEKTIEQALEASPQQPAANSGSTTDGAAR